MNIRFLQFPLLIRHAELVSASHVYDNECVNIKTLKQVQGDVNFYDALRPFKFLFNNRTFCLLKRTN
jgi:hypothetical protein